MEASPFFLPGWGTGARMPTPPWAPFPHLYPRGPSPPTPMSVPTQPGMPPLAKTLWAWACVVAGGGSCAREPGKVCLVCLPGRGKNWGPHPISPPFPAIPPPRLPSLSGLLDRPSRWAALLKLGPESSLPHLWWGEDFGVRQVGGGKGGSPYHLPLSAQGHLPRCVHHQETKR